MAPTNQAVRVTGLDQDKINDGYKNLEVSFPLSPVQKFACCVLIQQRCLTYSSGVHEGSPLVATLHSQDAGTALIANG